MENEKKLYCKNCKYCTGTKCYGHGEYWATCIIKKMLCDAAKINDVWKDVCNEEDECHIFKAFENSKKFNDKKYREIFGEKTRTIYAALKQYEPKENEWNRDYRIKQRDELLKHYEKHCNFEIEEDK